MPSVRGRVERLSYVVSLQPFDCPFDFPDALSYICPALCCAVHVSTVFRRFLREIRMTGSHLRWLAPSTADCVSVSKISDFRHSFSYSAHNLQWFEGRQDESQMRMTISVKVFAVLLRDHRSQAHVACSSVADHRSKLRVLFISCVTMLLQCTRRVECTGYSLSLQELNNGSCSSRQDTD